MKATRVRYTVQEEYAATNKENIEKVMADVRRLNRPGMKYCTFVLDDGVTFIHWAIFETEEDNKALGELASFNQFRMALKASNPVSPPQPENMSLVASGYDFF